MFHHIHSGSITQNTQLNDHTLEASTSSGIRHAVNSGARASNLHNAADAAVSNATRSLNAPQPQPMNRQDMVRDLDRWVNCGPAGERDKRIEAKNRILTAYDEKASTLNLDEISLTSLPDAIGNLVNLTGLNLRSNNLQTLPNTICNLVNLRVLDLNINRLQTLPDTFDKLTNLQELNLYMNQIKTLPLNLRAFWEQKKLILLDYKDYWSSKQMTCKERYGSVTYPGYYEGTHTDEHGTVLSGRMEWLSVPWGRLELVEGTKTYPDGRVKTGQWRQSKITGLMKRVGPSMPMPVALTPKEQLDADLETWTLSLQTDSNAPQLAEACFRIKTAIQNNSNRLDLSGLGLSTLPKRALNRLPQLTHLNLNGNPLDTLPIELEQLKNLTHLHMDLNQHRLAFIPTALKNWWKTSIFESLNGQTNTTLLAVHGKVKDEDKLVGEMYDSLLQQTTLPAELQAHPSYTAFFGEFVHRMQKKHAKQVAHLLEYSNIKAPVVVRGGSAVVAGTSLPFASLAGQVIHQGTLTYLIQQAKIRAERLLNNTTLSSELNHQFAKRLGVLFTEHFAADLRGYSSTQANSHQFGIMRRMGAQTKQTQVEVFARTMVKEVKRLVYSPEDLPPEGLDQKHRTLLYPIVLAQHVFDRVIALQPQTRGSGQPA